MGSGPKPRMNFLLTQITQYQEERTRSLELKELRQTIEESSKLLLVRSECEKNFYKFGGQVLEVETVPSDNGGPHIIQPTRWRCGVTKLGKLLDPPEVIHLTEQIIHFVAPLKYATQRNTGEWQGAFLDHPAVVDIGDWEVPDQKELEAIAIREARAAYETEICESNALSAVDTAF